MKYSIFYVIKGKAGRFQQKLAKIVGPRFGENYLIENPLPPHVTLKQPFRTTQIKNLEKIIKDFVKTQKPTKVKIRGFGNFDRFVAFMKVEFTKDGCRTQRQLFERLKSIKGFRIRKFDKHFNPHATIAYGNTKKKFNEIWDYLKTLEKPHFDFLFDNITIYKKPGKYWKIHKEFKIK